MEINWESIVLFKIWTRFAESTSNDDNHYTKSASR